MNRPKLPKKEFSASLRKLEDLLNGMASSLENIFKYLEEDRKSTDFLFQQKKESEMSVEERKNLRESKQDKIYQLEERIKVLEGIIKNKS